MEMQLYKTPNDWLGVPGKDLCIYSGQKSGKKNIIALLNTCSDGPIAEIKVIAKTNIQQITKIYFTSVIKHYYI